VSGSRTVDAPAASIDPPSPEHEDLDARYGRRGIRKGRRGIVIAAVALAAAAIAWFIWANPVNTSSLEWSDLTHSIDSPSQVTTTWRLVTPPDADVACAITAHGTNSAIVGWRIVDIPATGESVRDITESMRTSERGTNGFVYGCWLT